VKNLIPSDVNLFLSFLPNGPNFTSI
jgi:hypothetical protein